MTVGEIITEFLKLDQSLPVCQRIAEGADMDYLDTLSINITEMEYDDQEIHEDGPVIRKCVALEYW